ncbi:MAG: superoxide dismutase [Archangium gephyra]|uniref:Superoxide dismutase [Cu-Zn] n=1 Tax=Archangium gephyra TaxID=48 RepID=A0A2W5VWJ2_9BACT|nr:MAG: superoxide dismutase [Archangium gephyra]
MRTTLLLAALAFASCAHENKVTNVDSHAVAPVKARATLEPKSGASTTGEVKFAETAGEVTMQLSVSGATPGNHAVHLHVNGDCSSADGESAGPHWNPSEEAHGHLGHGPAHKGDIGNLVVGADGKGTLSFTTKEWTMGSGQKNDLVGRAVVVHASEDDFKSQPSGNAGGRIACGVVVLNGQVDEGVSGANR